mmetsp:Transcript_11731/g.21157  ORF Transcript_11731/g.21157 Transcript_11731/m.21157 type:complete len:250 (-) Transcript_11731:173-922(-)
MLSTSSDPYYVAKDEVETAIKKVQRMYEEWKPLLQRENTARNQRFQEIHSELAGEVRQLDHDLQDISATISMVEENRAKFQFDNSEIASRKRFVSDTRNKVREIQDAISSRATVSKIESDKRSLLSAAGSSARGNDDRQAKVSKENADFLSRQRQEQTQIVSQQDEALDQLSASAQRLGNTAQIINSELREQQKMLEALDEDIDKETEKLNFVMKRMGRLLKTSDNKQLCLIIGLIALIVVLIFLVINT